MSDREDASSSTNNTQHKQSSPGSETDTADAKPVIRYSKQILLALHDSPLVTKPPNIPPVSSWFSEDYEIPATKNILNGAVTSRSLANNVDKNILLAPNKSVFSSHTKRWDDAVSTKATQSSSMLGSRQRQPEEPRTREHGNNNKDTRSLRGQVFSGERAYPHKERGNDKVERRTNAGSAQNSSVLSYNGKRHPDRIHQNDNSKNRRENLKDRTGRTAMSDSERASEKLPEWMDYNPETDKRKQQHNISINKIEETPEHFMNDLEAWKSDMRRKDADAMEETSKDNTSAEPVLQAPSFIRTSSRDSPLTNDLERILGVGAIDLKATTGLSSSMDMLTATMLENVASPVSHSRRECGSRFAKFFAQREESLSAQEPKQTLSRVPADMEVPAQARSISVDDLFRTSSGLKQGTGIQRTPGDSPGSFNSLTDNRSNVRMLSEEEILQAIGANRTQLRSADTTSGEQEQQRHPVKSDALGFDRVLQILSQPKPVVPGQPKELSQNETFTTQKNTEGAIGMNTESGMYSVDLEKFLGTKPTREESDVLEPQAENLQQPTGSQATEEQLQPPENNTVPEPSSMTSAAAKSPKSETSDQGQSQKSKLVSSRFAGNLPTSVLRQMSARSSEGKSPSIASIKSSARSFYAAGSSSASTSPALSTRSPATLKANITSTTTPQQQQQQQQQPQQSNSPGSTPYGLLGAYRMPPHATGHSPGQPLGLDPSVAVPRQPGTGGPAFDHVRQFGDNVPPPMMPGSTLSGAPMNPMIPHPLPYLQGQQQQQQPGMEPFIAPHMMQPMGPPMPPTGMLSPHPMALHMQGQLPPQFHPAQGEMMHRAPGANDAFLGNVPPPPHLLGTGLPPHLFTKNQGWDRQ